MEILCVKTDQTVWTWLILLPAYRTQAQLRNQAQPRVQAQPRNQTMDQEAAEPHQLQLQREKGRLLLLCRIHSLFRMKTRTTLSGGRLSRVAQDTAYTEGVMNQLLILNQSVQPNKTQTLSTRRWLMRTLPPTLWTFSNQLLLQKMLCKRTRTSTRESLTNTKQTGLCTSRWPEARYHALSYYPHRRRIRGAGLSKACWALTLSAWQNASCT